MEQPVIRPIQPQDDPQIERVIRSCLIEFGANHEGTAWADPMLGQFSKVYAPAGRAYWVALDADGTVVAGAGIGELSGFDGVCELQKMYCLPDFRGTGLSHRLMEKALSFAAEHYVSVYLETCDNMLAAQRFYEKYGFERLAAPLGNTGHYACEVCYQKTL